MCLGSSAGSNAGSKTGYYHRYQLLTGSPKYSLIRWMKSKSSIIDVIGADWNSVNYILALCTEGSLVGDPAGAFFYVPYIKILLLSILLVSILSIANSTS